VGPEHRVAGPPRRDAERTRTPVRLRDVYPADRAEPIRPARQLGPDPRDPFEGEPVERVRGLNASGQCALVGRDVRVGPFPDQVRAHEQAEEAVDRLAPTRQFGNRVQPPLHHFRPHQRTLGASPPRAVMRWPDPASAPPFNRAEKFPPPVARRIFCGHAVAQLLPHSLHIREGQTQLACNLPVRKVTTPGACLAAVALATGLRVVAAVLDGGAAAAHGAARTLRPAVLAQQREALDVVDQARKVDQVGCGHDKILAQARRLLPLLLTHQRPSTLLPFPSLTTPELNKSHRPIVEWRGGSSELSLDVIGDVTESSIIRVIREHRGDRQFVFVDLEGTASRLVSRAITQADLVLIPLQASGVDARQASRAVALIHEEEEALNGRVIPFRVLLTRTSPIIATRIEKEIVAALKGAGLPLMRTRLNERQAYKAVFVRRLAMHELDPVQVNGLPEALTNAQQLADELVDILTNSSPNAQFAG